MNPSASVISVVKHKSVDHPIQRFLTFVAHENCGCNSVKGGAKDIKTHGAESLSPLQLGHN
ncbi:MAG: hypothetical protein KGJ13_10620 [Patescibacteria group bacterium]|nr:hypothetical protein [Patescibacteria group bacterium]